MGKFSKIKKYSKPSHEIDEKIKKLDEQLKKTLGESIVNNSSEFYNLMGFDSGVPEVPAIPAVPPTYEDVTGGLSNPNDFVWGDQGDGSDPNAAINIPSNLYTTYNGEQVAAARYIEGTYPDGVIPLGYVIRDGWLSTNSVGYLSSGGFTPVASVGVFANASTDLGRAYQEAYYRWPFPGKIEKTIYLWSSLDCLFGDCKGGSQYYPSNLSATSTPKADRALYAYTLWIPAGADGNVLPNRFMTDPGSPEIPAIPAIPPKPITLSRYGLGDPNFFPGFIKNIQDLLGLGETAIKAVMDYTSKLIAPLADALGTTAQTLLTYASAAPPFIAHLAQQQGLANYTEQNPFQIYLSPQTSANVSSTLNNVLQTIPRERWENLSSTDLQKINSALNQKDFGQYSYTFYNIGNPNAFAGKIKTDPNTGLSYVSGLQDNYIFTSDLDAAGIPGAKDLLNLAMTANDAQNRSDMQSSPYTYTPGVPGLNTPELQQKNTPIATNLPAPQLTQSSFNALPSSVQKQVMDTMKQNYLNQFSASNYQGKELSSYRDSAKETQKQVAQNTEFKNGYMIQKQVGSDGRTTTTRIPLFKENKIRKGKVLNEAIDVEDVKLKLREIDVLRHYKVSEKESKELADIIYKINLILDENPEHLEYLKKRYPKDDVRLAELNYKMDRMLSASEEYVETHFPENQRLFKKVQQSIKRNIKLTDPKTFKNVEEVPSYKKLLSVDYVNQNEVPKKKIKLQNRNKKTAARFLKKPRKKTAMELIDEKIIQLDNDIIRTLGESIVNNTSSLYQQGDTETIPPVSDEWNATFPDGPEGPTITGAGGAKLSNDGNFGTESFIQIRRNYPQYTKNNGVYPYTSTGYWSWVWVSVNFAADWGNRTNSFGEKYGVTPGGRYIQGYYTSLNAIDPRLIAGGSRIHESDPVLGYKVYYWPNNYPATKIKSGAFGTSDPNFLPILAKDRGNIKGKDPWDKVKEMLDAGKEWMDKMFGERMKDKRDRIKDLLKSLSENALRGLEDVLQFTEDKFEEFVGDSIEKSIGMGSAALTLSAFFDQQEGKANYTQDKPYTLPYGQGQKQDISNAFENTLNYTDNMGFDLRGKIDRGEKFTQQEIDFLNQKMNFEFGSTSPEGFGFYRTFGKFSPNVQITKNSNGGYDITDNYVYTDLNDFDGGNIEIGNLKLGPGVKGQYYAEKDKGDVDFFDSDTKDKKRIGSLKQMYITTSLPGASLVKEEKTFEDMQKQLILEELDYDLAIKKLENILEKNVNEKEKVIKRLKLVSTVVSPQVRIEDILEKNVNEKVIKRFKSYSKAVSPQVRVREEKRYDWRKELSEQMTTTDVFYTTLPSTGDTDLQAISGGDQSSFDPDFTDGIEFGTSGNGSGRMGGFDIGVNYLKFSQTPDQQYNSRNAGTIKVDTSNYTTVTISAIVGNNSNGGVSPTTNLLVYWFSATDGGILGQIPSNGGSLTDYSFTLPTEARGQNIDIFLYEPDVPDQRIQYIGQSIPSLHPSIWNDDVAGWANNILSKSNPTTDDFDYYGGAAWTAMQQQVYGAASAYTWNSPGYPAPVSGLTNGTIQADRIAIGQAIYNAFGNGSSTRYPLTYGITNIGFRRVSPINVFVTLDSPEATSFIRTDPAFSGLSEEEKLKKLKEMIEASDEYVMKMFGANFPGTGAVTPGEYDPFAQPPPGEAGDTPGVSVSTPPTYLYPGGLVTSGKVTGLTPIRQVYPSQSGSQPGSHKINATHTYDVVTDSGIEKRTMNLPINLPLDAKGNYVNPFGDESPKNTTSSQQQSEKQKAVLSNPEVANAVEKLGTAGKAFLDYLTNNLPNMIDNKYLGQEYVNSVFKNAQINHKGTVSVGDNIVGTGGKATYDPKTNKVSIPFNYDFKTNDQEFSDPSKAGVSDFQKAVLNALGPYSADAQPNLPPILAPVQSLAGIVLGGAIGASKTLGGAQHRSGNVTMDADELKKLNPAFYNQVVKEEVLPEERKNAFKRFLAKTGYYDGKPSPLGFPMDEPPKMVNGMHPDLVDGKKVADRFNRLDPESAKAMPLTGNPHIDKKVKAARKKPK